MRVLVVGGGGREHALAWKLSLDPSVSQVFVAPGNPGMELDQKISCLPIPANDFERLFEAYGHHNLNFVLVGPDQALADGVVDFFESKNIPIFGPTKNAAKIEWSKGFAKELMRVKGIPTARFENFSELAAAKKFMENVPWGNGWVIKADGLALGKGVIVCESREEALRAMEEFLSGSMGESGRQIVVEERLLGREASGFYFCDGTTSVQLGFACDYKRLLDGDKGPNTGGMGVYSPADWLPEGTSKTVQEKIVIPLLEKLREIGSPYKGILFVGLMITKEGPQVIEFNARFGDPETQGLMPLMDEELLPWLMASAKGNLTKLPAQGPKLKSAHAVHVVLAAHGYPGSNGQIVRKGDPIRFPSEWPTGTKLFFAGVTGKDLVTNGGRVLGVTALGEIRAIARKNAYSALEQIHFAGSQRRTDVGL